MVAFPPSPGTSGTRPPPTLPRRSPRPSSTVLPRSTPRSVASPHARPLPAGRATDTSPAEPDPNAADPPSQPPSVQLLRRPLESALHPPVAVVHQPGLRPAAMQGHDQGVD